MGSHRKRRNNGASGKGGSRRKRGDKGASGTGGSRRKRGDKGRTNTTTAGAGKMRKAVAFAAGLSLGARARQHVASRSSLLQTKRAEEAAQVACGISCNESPEKQSNSNSPIRLNKKNPRLRGAKYFSNGPADSSVADSSDGEASPIALEPGERKTAASTRALFSAGAGGHEREDGPRRSLGGSKQKQHGVGTEAGDLTSHPTQSPSSISVDRSAEFGSGGARGYNLRGSTRFAGSDIRVPEPARANSHLEGLPGKANSEPAFLGKEERWKRPRSLTSEKSAKRGGAVDAGREAPEGEHTVGEPAETPQAAEEAAETAQE
ncbi:unnamed protein product, partial [Amoebophrya sp. A25]|eukprot:GSA25T00003605001.1